MNREGLIRVAAHLVGTMVIAGIIYGSCANPHKQVTKPIARSVEFDTLYGYHCDMCRSDYTSVLPPKCVNYIGNDGDRKISLCSDCEAEWERKFEANCKKDKNGIH